jgi:hypothetical protein
VHAFRRLHVNRGEGGSKLGRWFRVLSIAWVGWLRFEFRALAILLPVACFEMTAAGVLISHLPVYLGTLGALPALLARDAWRFAALIRVPERLVPR